MRPFLNRTRSATLAAPATTPLFPTDPDAPIQTPPNKRTSMKNSIMHLPNLLRKTSGTRYTDLSSHDQSNQSNPFASPYDQDDDGLPAWQPPTSTATYTASVTSTAPPLKTHRSRFSLSRTATSTPPPMIPEGHIPTPPSTPPTTTHLASKPLQWMRGKRARANSAPVKRVETEEVPVPSMTFTKKRFPGRKGAPEEKGRLRHVDMEKAEEDAEEERREAEDVVSEHVSTIGGYPYPYGRESIGGRESYDAGHLTEQRGFL